MLSSKCSLWLAAGFLLYCAFPLLAPPESPGCPPDAVFVWWGGSLGSPTDAISVCCGGSRVLAFWGPSAQEQHAGSAPQASPSPLPAQDQRRAPEPAVLIDASHGGDDKGAVFSNKLAEKDVTLSLARELRKELAERGVASKMVREGDVSIALDRRAEIANEPHTLLYVALHAAPPGKGVRVYAPVVTSPQPATGRFLPWESAQTSSLERSRKIAQAVANELKRKDIQVMLLNSSLRPLNNVVPPAIAVELAPEPGNVRSLESERLQNAVASAIAVAVAQTRGLTGGHP